MKAEIAVLSGTERDRELLQKAGRIIREGGLVAFPTETVYGLGGNALDPEASRKIYAAKGRPSDNPLIVHISNLEDLFSLASGVPEKALMLAEKCWPGPLTIILPKSDRVPSETTGGLGSVAVRFPDHPAAAAFIREAGGFVAAPSANLSGRPSPTTAAHVIEDLGERIDMILDGGKVGIGLESSIVDFTEEIPTILRPGYFSLEMLRDILGEVRMDTALILSDSNVRPKAPGMKYRHYAPKAPLQVVYGQKENVIRFINEKVKRSLEDGGRPGVICAEESLDSYPEGTIFCVGSRHEEDTIARGLYEVLRQSDRENITELYSEAFDTPRMGGAIMNRLLKAAGQKIINADTKTGN